MRAAKKKKLFWLFACAVVIFIAFATNWAFHVCHKPSELTALIERPYFKKPKETWSSYGPLFKRYSTKIITPDFLAALAQTETGGNTFAHTYWQWNFAAKTWFGIYAPASSAVGLLQITDGTFKEAQNYCVMEGHVYLRGPWSSSECRVSSYNRLIPDDSVEMTSAYLHLYVTRLLHRHHVKHLSLEKKQELAALIHLCGAHRGETYLSRHFHLKKNDKCGPFQARHYLATVQRFKRIFKRLSVGT